MNFIAFPEASTVAPFLFTADAVHPCGRSAWYLAKPVALALLIVTSTVKDDPGLALAGAV